MYRLDQAGSVERTLESASVENKFDKRGTQQLRRS
jgi:hypothetical protein